MTRRTKRRTPRECQPPFPAAGAGADDASRRQDDSRHHGDDILAEAMLRRAVITVPGQGETECPRGGIPLCVVFRGCRRGRGIPCGWCAYGTVSFAADACFDPDDAVQDMAPFAAKPTSPVRRAPMPLGGGAGWRVPQAGVCRSGAVPGVSPESRVWRAVLALPSAARVSGTGSAGAPACRGIFRNRGSVRRCPVRCAAAAAYRVSWI